MRKLTLIALLLGVPVADTFAQAVTVFAPGIVSVSGRSLYRGSFSPDGNEFYFFRKVTKDAEDYRIFLTHRTGDSWSEPVQLDIGESGHSDLYPAVSPDGRYLVFSSYRPAGGEYDRSPNAYLWMSERRGDGWGDAVLLGGLSEPGAYHAAPLFGAAGKMRFKKTRPDWSRTDHLIVDFKDGEFGIPGPDGTLAPWHDWRRDQVHIWDGVPSPDGSVMMLDVSEIDDNGSRKPTDQWASVRSGSDWTRPVRLGAAVNTGSFENFAVFSPEGEYLYFVRGFSTYLRVATDVIKAEVVESER